LYAGLFIRKRAQNGIKPPMVAAAPWEEVDSDVFQRCNCAANNGYSAPARRVALPNQLTRKFPPALEFQHSSPTTSVSENKTAAMTQSTAPTDQDVTNAASAEPDNALEQALARIATLEDEFLRFRAEAENQRRRVMKDAESARKFAAEKLLQELLPVADTLMRGLEVAKGEKATVENLIEGKEATMRMLAKALENNGVKEINPVGEAFNPEWHQAMSVQPAADGVAPNSVVAVFQRGYMLNERLLRPALVVVSQA
jgi:molecular chaperone GrpE